MSQTLAHIDESLRMPAPCPQPMSLACDGPNLWVGSAETSRLYGLNARWGTVFEESTAPGTPFGACITGGALRVIVNDADDNRFIRRYIFGKDFKTESIPCPQQTGSFLAYDGDSLFVSQRFDQRIVELDQAGVVLREIPVPFEITGMTIVNGLFYLVTTESAQSEEYRLMRLDARREPPEIVELAAIPFRARSLAFDGSRFWTNIRSENTIVAFAKPD